MIDALGFAVVALGGVEIAGVFLGIGEIVQSPGDILALAAQGAVTLHGFTIGGDSGGGNPPPIVARRAPRGGASPPTTRTPRPPPTGPRPRGRGGGAPQISRARCDPT